MGMVGGGGGVSGVGLGGVSWGEKKAKVFRSCLQPAFLLLWLCLTACLPILPAPRSSAR